MSNEYPPLALDDIVHLMSPSPSILDDTDLPPRNKSTSPEPLPESDIVQMRRTVLDMRHIHKPGPHLSQREMDLADMVLRLTAAVRPDPDQLLRQADMISALIQQRDLLLHQAEEQRLQWNSEKDGWARMAEALLAQQAKNRPERDEDFGRLYAVESDNKGLRQRLNESQSRLQVLESELTRLRPLLLMQPLISRSSLPPPTPNPKTQHARRRKRDVVATEDETHGSSEDEPPGDTLDTPSHAPLSQATPKQKSRKSEAPSNHPHTNPSKRRPSQKATFRGLSADARVEHLLLAARRIGKHRAGIMSGMMQHLEERERERRREDSAATAVASTPKTPKRHTAHTAYPPEGAYVYFSGQMRPGAGIQPVPMFIPAYPHHLLQTPSSSTTAPSATSSAQQSAQKSKQDATSNNPPTPLDSLLTAARSMMREDVDVDEDEDEEIDVVGDSPGSMAGARHARSKGTLGSPVPKRRKVVARTDKLTASRELTSRTTNNALSSTNVNGVGLGRIRSALDVLADQAAAFSTQEQATIPLQAQMRTKGKGKERADPQPQEPSSSTPKPRGRTKSRRRESEAGTPTPSPAPPTSHAGTPRSDMGDDHLAGSTTQNAQPQVGGSASEAPVDPGGGTGSANTSQTLDSSSGSQAHQHTTGDGAQSPGSLDKSLHVDDPGNVTPKQARAQDVFGEGARVTDVETNSVSVSGPPIPEDEPLPSHTEATPSGSGGQNGKRSGSGVAAPAKSKELIRVVEQGVSAAPTKRQRSPYIKWSKEEDDLLAEAVAKYGQKWDLVQKALPSRGYHQVRQRWLRKLGVFDSKPDLSSFQTAATSYSSTSRGGEGIEPRGNPKLGLAPLSSEKAFSGMVGRPSSLPS